MIELAFWTFVIFIFYAYVGYPLALRLLGLFRSCPIVKADIVPQVSFIIAAHNEESRISAKIENTLAQSFPAEKLEIIVASDCSTDGTDEIVRRYATKGVTLVRSPIRGGKEKAQKLAVESSRGDILIFSDVATILAPVGVANIVKNFADPTIGCVSSHDQFIDQEGNSSGEGMYVRYEMSLRALESRVNSLVGLSGSFFAARRAVCKDHWSENLQSDFNTLLNSVRIGLRGVADPDSIGYYKNILDERKEFDRKVRTVLRGISVFMKSLALINPLRYPIFAWQLVSHKLCRWLVPFGMIGALVCNAVLAWQSGVYSLLLGVQLGFYSLAVTGLLYKRMAQFSVVKLPAFFVLVNVSILQAWWRYLTGERLVAWEPSRR